MILLHPHTRTGKIARLPQPLRESVNLMLQENRPYAAILAHLAEHGFQLNYHSLKRWRQGGYQDWLQERQRAAHTQVREEFLHKLVQHTDSAYLPPTLVQLAGAQCFDLLLEFEREGHIQQMKTDSMALVHFVQTFLQLTQLGATFPAPPPFPATHPTPCQSEATVGQPLPARKPCDAGEPAAPGFCPVPQPSTNNPQPAKGGNGR